jgi:hypothetical protein
LINELSLFQNQKKRQIPAGSDGDVPPQAEKERRRTRAEIIFKINNHLFVFIISTLILIKT